MRRAGLGMLLGGVVATACSSNSATAFPSVNGPVTITPVATVPSGQSLESGQTVTITVAPNSTLSRSSLESAGIPSGATLVKAAECVDPGGLKSNLPTTPTNNCDNLTIGSTPYVNADGSFRIANYHVYALPDHSTLLETPDNKPACGSSPNYCVLYIGPDQNNFTKPHLFSGPFLVAANSTDNGSAAPGTQSPTSATGSAAAGVALSTTSSAGSTSGSAGGTGSGALAYTGAPDKWEWMIGIGLTLYLVGLVGRRRLKPRVVT